MVINLIKKKGINPQTKQVIYFPQWTRRSRRLLIIKRYFTFAYCKAQPAASRDDSLRSIFAIQAVEFADSIGSHQKFKRLNISAAFINT